MISAVLTASQSVLPAAEGALSAHSEVAIFAVVTKVAIAGRLTRYFLWLNGAQCEEK